MLPTLPYGDVEKLATESDVVEVLDSVSNTAYGGGSPSNGSLKELDQNESPPPELNVIDPNVVPDKEGTKVTRYLQRGYLSTTTVVKRC
jgi:hypothetical protein